MITRRSFLEIVVGSAGTFALSGLPSALAKACYSESMYELNKGLWYGEFKADKTSIVGDSKIKILRADPSHYDLKLLMGSQYKEKPLTARNWVKKYNLIAAINAGMFRDNYKTNCGFAKNGDYINNGKLTPDYNTIIAFNPKNKDSPRFKMIDFNPEDFQKIEAQYNTIVQNLRMTDKDGKNMWKQSNKKWSQACVGRDSKGRILFLHSKSPYSVYDFNEIIRKLPLNMRNSMHVEGGPEASFSLNYEPVNINYTGSFETNFNENNFNLQQWPIPNIFGIVKRKD